MKVMAYCGQDWARAMRASTGIQPVTCPPLEAGSKPLYEFLEEAATGDVLALNLHGYLGQANYYGQADRRAGPTALTVDDVIPHDWNGVTVFLEICFSAADDLANRIIPQMFLERGALAVIGSRTAAYGRMRGTFPWPGFDGEADRLLSLFLFFLKRGQGAGHRGVGMSLVLARRIFRLWSWPLDADDRATMRSFTTIKQLGVKDETEMV